MARFRPGIIIVLFFPVLCGCAAGPSKTEAAELIRHHLESRGYRVLSIEIGHIRTMETSKKRYMGTPGFIVEIRQIALEDRTPGRQLSFRDASVEIRQKPGEGDRWEITRIDGIPII